MRGKPQEFKVKREDPPDIVSKKSIDWTLRLAKLTALIERTKDEGWYIIGSWDNPSSAGRFRGILEGKFPKGWEFKAWASVQEKKSKLYAKRK